MILFSCLNLMTVKFQEALPFGLVNVSVHNINDVPLCQQATSLLMAMLVSRQCLSSYEL